MQPIDGDFMRELMTVFSAEAEERLDVIDQRMLELERNPVSDGRSELLSDILRELHTLKGSAGAVGMDEASRLAHALESLLGAIRPADLVTPQRYELSFGGLDALRTLISDAAEGREESPDVHMIVTGLCDALQAAALEVAAGDGVADLNETNPPVSDDADMVLWDEPDPFELDEADAEVEVPQPEDVPQPEPVATVAPDPPSGPGPAPSPELRAARSGHGAQVDETVRLTTHKLDALMSRVGELLMTRLDVEQRAEQVRTVTQTVGNWERDWRRVRPQYLEVANSLESELISPEDQARLVTRMRELLPILEQNDVRLRDLGQQIRGVSAGMDSAERRLGQVAGDLEDEVRGTRMLPVSSVLDPFQRMVRDLSRELGKEARLVTHGGDAEVDRSVLEQLRAPLTHLIRNSMDHGLEAPDVREQSGKDREGTIQIAATERGGTLLIGVSDDGSGIDVARVRAAALDNGVVGADQLRAMSDRDVLRLIFRSGLSTSRAVTDISGRGVGLDAVRETVERIYGSIDVSSVPDVGTTFTLSLPLSVATTRCLLVEVAGHRLALPISLVTRTVAVNPDDIQRAQGREMLVLDDGPVVVARLEDVLQLTTKDIGSDGGRKSAVIVRADEHSFALLIDGLIGTQNVVVKPLPQPFVRVRHVAGATVLGSGETVLVLNTSDLFRTAGRAAVPIDRGAMKRQSVASPDGLGTVLVVDDSVVTRMLEKSILEAAGYTVRVAADGVEALRSLEANPVDLVVSDVNMPNMDGLALTSRIRAHGALKATPIVLVTSLDAPEDRARGLDAGADAYIVKSSFSQEGLLETVSRLI